MSMFDAEELLHLAMHASGQQRPEEALNYLKECLELEPDNVNALSLLAANYAQLGLYERAKPLFQRTLELAPGEPTPAFQLGLLHLTGGDLEAARSTWQTLEPLGADHCLTLFAQGLLALTGRDVAGAIAALDAGIRANGFNPALNADMLKIRDSAAALLSASAAQPEPEPEPSTTAAEPSASYALDRLVLSGYRQSQDQP